MTTPTFLASEALWAEIRRLAASSRVRRMVAVAYVGPNSLAPLRLGKDDAIHCALSLRNARAGVVCPSELIRLRRKHGVRIYADEHLHAKVYVFGGAAIVCSANASRRSASLDEAGLLTREPGTVAAIKAWFEARQDVEVSDYFLARCDAAYRPPRWNPFADVSRTPGRLRRRKRPWGVRPRNDAERWWLLWNVRDRKYSEEEESIAQQTVRDARARVRTSRWPALDTVSWYGNNEVVRGVRVGDKVVRMFAAGRGKVVTPWGTCQAVRRWTDRRGTRHAMLVLELPNSDARLAYTAFRTRAQAFGLSLPVRGRSESFSEPEQIRVLRRLTRAGALGS